MTILRLNLMCHLIVDTMRGHSAGRNADEEALSLYRPRWAALLELLDRQLPARPRRLLHTCVLRGGQDRAGPVRSDLSGWRRSIISLGGTAELPEVRKSDDEERSSMSMFDKPTCAVKIEYPHGSDKWEHCPEPVACWFVDKEEDVPLCERCARNVRHGDYGARLRDLLIEQGV